MRISDRQQPLGVLIAHFNPPSIYRKLWQSWRNYTSVNLHEALDRPRVSFFLHWTRWGLACEPSSCMDVWTFTVRSDRMYSVLTTGMPFLSGFVLRTACSRSEVVFSLIHTLFHLYFKRQRRCVAVARVLFTATLSTYFSSRFVLLWSLHVELHTLLPSHDDQG